jgi:hypothetical protein
MVCLLFMTFLKLDFLTTKNTKISKINF